LLYLLDKDVRTVRWNGEPLHEATSAIIKETMNGDFTLTVKYPISDSEIYQLIQEDMLIKAPTPILGAQLFRIKTPVEHNDHLEITAYHISDDVMQRSIKPLSVSSQSCDMALSRMVQNTKTALGDFSFNSDIQERRTFNTTETETLYSLLLDGKHSIVGTWEGELVRDNFAITVKKNRGENRGVVITTHKNLKDYHRTRNSQNVVTRIHAKSTFKPEGAETETTLKVTVDSPLINSYPYINEKEYENNNANTVEELKKWAQAKFTNQGIDKVSDAIKIEAYELDGQVVHMGDTVNIKSRKHNVDAFKKAIAYEFDALKEEYISLTFDDKAGTGSSRSSGGLSNAADAIIGVTESAQEIALEKALQNADLAFDHQAGLLRQEILDGVELAKAKAEENKRALSDEIDRRFHEFSPAGFEEAKTKAEEALKKASASAELADEAKHIADQNQITFASMADRVNKQENKLTEYKQDTEGRFASIASQVSGKANQTDFQRVRETSQLYERILGSSESDISRNASRLVMSDQRFQTEVGKYVTDDNNLIVNSMTMNKHTLIGNSNPKANISVNNGIFTIKAQGLTGYNWSGFSLPIYVKKIYKDETYTLGFKYRIREYPDSSFAFNVKNHGLNKILLSSDIGKNRPPLNEWQEFQKTFTVQEDFAFGEDANYPFYIYLAKNGWIEFKEPILVRGSRTGTYKPSQFDDAYKQTKEAKELAENAQARAIQVAEKAEEAKRAAEETRIQITQKLAEYKETSDGRFATISTQISGKADQSDFQRVKETSQLYERILGTTEQDVADNASRLVMSSQIFQTEVKKLTESGYNLVFDPTNFSKWEKKQPDADVVEVSSNTKLLRITNTGKTNSVYHGFRLPLNTSTFTEGEKLSYRMEVWVDVLPDAPLGIEIWAEDTGITSDRVYFTKTGIQIITGTMTVKKSSTKGKEFPLEIWLMKNGQVAIGKVSLIRGETPPNEFKDDTSAQDVVTQTKVTQLSDSYAIQTLTNAGAIASQINLNSNNILIEAAKIRLKGRTLLDEITAIDGYFKRLFVGDAQIGTLNTDIIRSNSIAADKLIFDTALAKKLVASDVFTDTLAAKTAFINKLRSVVVSATLLEGYKGKIGGFQIGTHDQDSTTFWLTGSNSFRVGMSDGGWKVNQTCLWVNWGNDWGKPGNNAWYVTNSGAMFCRGDASFYRTVDFSSTSSVNFYGNNSFYKDVYMRGGTEIYGTGSTPRKGGKNSVVWWNQVGDGSVKYHIDRASDKRLKENILPTRIKAMDIINKLDMVEFDFIENHKHEEVGLIAQEVEKIIPQAISRNPDNEDDFLHIDYNTFVPYLIKAIQELNQKIEGLEKTI
jgi:phage minor structural protein, N-terminal domain protein